MEVANQEIKERVMEELEKLTLEKLEEVLDFVVFLRSRTIREKEHTSVSFLPASNLDSLVGLVAWGGDALVDSERLYD